MWLKNVSRYQRFISVNIDNHQVVFVLSIWNIAKLGTLPELPPIWSQAFTPCHCCCFLSDYEEQWQNMNQATQKVVARLPKRSESADATHLACQVMKG